jgi:uncharacterized protein YjbJ (UPF0337 family)
VGALLRRARAALLAHKQEKSQGQRHHPVGRDVQCDPPDKSDRTATKPLVYLPEPQWRRLRICVSELQLPSRRSSSMFRSVTDSNCIVFSRVAVWQRTCLHWLERNGKMKDSTKDKVEGAVHDAKGNIKEKVGHATNNPNLEAEGQDEKVAGKIQKKVGDVEKVFEK